MKARCAGGNELLRIGLAEFLGTFFLCFLGNGAVHEKVLTGGSDFQVCFTFGMGVTFGVYISAGVSGGHINPAVTVAMASLGRLGKTAGEAATLVLVYIVSQVFGAFMSSFFVYIAYMPAEDYLAEKYNLTHGLSSLYTTWPTETWSEISAVSSVICIVHNITGW